MIAEEQKRVDQTSVDETRADQTSVEDRVDEKTKHQTPNTDTNMFKVL